MTYARSDITTETLAEAVAIASYALEEELGGGGFDDFCDAVGDEELIRAFLAVAGHVCELKGYLPVRT